MEYLGPVDYDRGEFAKALEGRHKSYDPKEKMVGYPYSRGTYHYHTGYRGDVVHPTRNSLEYAVACLDSGDDELFQRGTEIIQRVIGLQDTDANSRTFGIWSWYLEEPLDVMDAPDFNWADFCGVQLLQAVLRHGDRFSDELYEKIKTAVLNAAYSIKKRNVGPGYTNIAIMGTYVSLVAGDLYDDEVILNYGKERLNRFYEYTMYHGGFTEYNSPTYTVVALKEIGRMLRDVKNEECIGKIVDLYKLVWKHIGRHFHEPTRQWAGPNSRAYRDLESKGFWYLIQRCTDNKIQFVPSEELPFDMDYAVLTLKYPDEYLHYFHPLSEPRQEIEVFYKGREHPSKSGEFIDLPVIGTTFLHPKYALGTVNRCDFWNQRRPAILHFGTWKKPSYARFRFFHDDYDYSSALFFGTQWKNRALIGVNFATDYGDKHLSLNKVIDATIQAKEVRLRLEIGGNIESLTLPEKWESGKPIDIDTGNITMRMWVTHAQFGDYQIKYDTGRDDDKAWVDVIIYDGEERSINFNEIDHAALGIGFEILNGNSEGPKAVINNGRLIQRWNCEDKDLMLSIPVKPNKVGMLQRAVIRN
ncbi:hypothetical protein GF312_06655 [Candidatus Poribacteria bacterium]|nr:hypothetical protein [Candidatus Poribacteria bacterium]